MMTFRKRLIVLTLSAILALLLPLTTSGSTDKQHTVSAPQRMRMDTLQHMVRRLEMPPLRGRMLTSPLPVEISQQGRQLCIKSRYNQLLPIYTASGTYYSSMRLAKGTNWLTGLPRGAYMINNHRYTIN